jgi:hypothetical protein
MAFLLAGYPAADRPYQLNGGDFMQACRKDTTIARTVADLLTSDCRIDLIRQAISDARREGLVADSEARQLHRSVAQRLKDAASSGHDLAEASEKRKERDVS